MASPGGVRDGASRLLALGGAGRRLVRVVPQGRRLLATSRAAAAEYGCGPLAVARIARRLRRRQGFEYPEALRAGALDPALPEADRALFVSAHATFEATAPLNNRHERQAFAWDKAAFYPYFDALGMPVPRLFGILRPRASGASSSGRIVMDAADLRAFLAHDVPERFVLKPAEGYHGLGVRLLTRLADGRLRQHPDRELDAGQLLAELSADPEFETWVVQELVTNHPDVGRLGGSEGLDSVRIATVVERDGGVDMLFAFLKLALGGGASDNFLGGSTGNGLVPISLEDGRLGPIMVPTAAGIGYRRLARNPTTGVQVEGERLPAWREACELAVRAARHLLPTRAVGWDIALSPTGPVIIEANTHWVILPPGPSARAPYERLCAASGVTPR